MKQTGYMQRLRRSVMRVFLGGTAGLFLTASAPAPVPFSATDLSVLGITLHFMSPAPAKSLRVAVVYNPSVSGSEDEARQILSGFPADEDVSGFSMTPFLARADTLGTESFGAVISADGAGTDALAQALLTRHVLCVTPHQDQMATGACPLYVASQSAHSKILLNQDAAQKDGLKFAAAFLIMLHSP